MKTKQMGWMQINGKFHYGELTEHAQFYSKCGHYRENASVKDIVAEESQCEDCKTHKHE